jgi:hypothetical protein
LKDCICPSLIIFYERTVVVHDKSILLPKIIRTNTKTSQLLSMNIKTENIYKSYKNCQAGRLALGNIESCIKGGGAQRLRNKSAKVKIRFREYSVKINICSRSKS